VTGNYYTIVAFNTTKYFMLISLAYHL
jgi:hypothetical protein